VHSILKRISEDDVCVVRKSLSEHEDALSKAIESFCREHRLAYCILSHDDLCGFPYEPPKATEHSRDSTAEGRTRKVLVTGSFDWLHSGHIRFFEEAAMYGQLIVVVGNDANIRLLKGEGHPPLR
jgi:cytidyltransferase-like protein